MTTEARVAIEERDKVRRHLENMKKDLRRKRDEQLEEENRLLKTLNKYSYEP
jgi:hypothetical protein